MQLSKEQEQGVRIAVDKYWNGEKYVCIAGYAGCGKAQPNETLIPTPLGWRYLGELKVGDFVYDRRGHCTEVLGVYPQGKKEKYKITLSDQRVSYCADDHIWACYNRKGQLQNYTAKELYNKGYLTKKYKYKYALPLNGAVEYPEQELPQDPYLVGAFIINGLNLNADLTLESYSKDLPQKIGNLLCCTPIDCKDTFFQWKFQKISYAHSQDSMQDSFKMAKTEDYFMSLKSALMVAESLRYIPLKYKMGSINQRKALIQGICDANSKVIIKHNKCHIKISTTSSQLAEDIQEILWSLGYSAKIKKIIGPEIKEEDHIVSLYKIIITATNTAIKQLFSLQKQKLFIEDEEVESKPPQINIVKVEKTNDFEEMTCIYVANPEHLYLTNDYIVTHNTSLVKYIIAELGLAPDEVAYCAYTGKAAEVLRKHGCPNACTAHALLYYNKKLPDGTFLHKPKPHLDHNYRVIVVDEVSMLPKEMWELLLSHKIFIIASGDPFQLPCLDPRQDNQVLNNPDIFLTKIFRQEDGDEIITLSLALRENKAIIPYDGKTVKIIRQQDVIPGMYLWADQIICSTNAKRHAINNYVRELKGLEGDPQEGDKIISLTNHWNITDFGGEASLTNGTSGILTAAYFDNAHYPVRYKWFPKQIPLIRGHFIADDGADFGYLPIDHTFITEGHKFLSDSAESVLMKMKTLANEVPLDFDYGYAISVWKSQGSSWGKVLVFEERFPYDDLEHRRALYTAVTRAENKLVLVLQ